jgi:ferredoxin
MVFTTSAGLENAHGVHSLSRKLVKKGYRIVGQPLFPMPRNYYFGRYEPTPQEAQERLVSEVPGKVTEALAWLNGDEGEFPLQRRGKVLSQDLMAELFSVMARGMGRHFTSFAADCTKCGRCVRECPQKNIEAKPGGGVVFGRRCMLCTRCLHNCPAGAIGYDGVKYIRYSGPPDLNTAETRRSNS